MTSHKAPQGPWYNPNIDDGDYAARIVDLAQGEYGSNKDMFLQVIFWLKQPQCYFVTNLYFPADKPNAKAVNRLSALCQIVGLVPQDALDSPREFRGAELKVRTKRFKKDDDEYCDVERFLPSATPPVA